MKNRIGKTIRIKKCYVVMALFGLMMMGSILRHNRASAVDSSCSGFSNSVTNNYISSISSVSHISGTSPSQFNLSIGWTGDCKKGNSTICARTSTPTCSHPSASDGSDQAYSAVGYSISIKRNGSGSCTHFSNAQCEKFTVRYIPSDCSNTKNDKGYIGHQTIDFNFERKTSVTIAVKVKDNYTQEVIPGYSSSTTVQSGGSATVSGVFNIPGYYFITWGSSCPQSSGTNCVVSNATSNKTIYVHYKKKFTLTAKSINEGGTSLAGVTGLGDTSSTVWQGDSASVTRGTTSAGYTFVGWRTSLNGAIVDTKLSYPAKLTTGNATVYAVYRPFNAKSSLDLMVKNNSVATYDSYGSEVYAKPGDSVTYRANYKPEAQKGKDLVPQKMSVNRSAEQPPNVANTTSSLSTLFGSYSGLGPWTNILVTSGKVADRYDIGVEQSGHQTKTFDYSVIAGDVGSANSETVATDVGTPSEVSIGLNGSGLSLANVSTGLSASADVKVPYNYVNTASMNTPEDRVYYAGENETAETLIKVNKRRNDVTDGTYATKVPNAMWKLRICYGENSDNCSETDAINLGGKDGTLNESGDMDGGEPEQKTIGFSVGDYPAGTKMCISTAVFPANSGEATNWNNTAGSGTWSDWSEPAACYVIAKRPNLQVWGGSIYTDGRINAALSKKGHLAGYDEYNASPTDGNLYIFGSWGELGVIATDEVKGFASGSSLGYLANENGLTYPNPFASVDTPNAVSGEYPGGYFGKYDYCKLSELTMANEDCHNDKAGSLGTNTAIGGISKDRDSVRNLAEALGLGEKVDVSGVLSVFQNDINYYKAVGNLTIGQSDDLTVSEDRTILIHGEGNILISKNIVYKNDGYQNLLQTPKLIIYSDKTINIDCTVTRIDAVLLAETVNTCPSENNNSRQNSNQLFIYGAVIANTLKANRTYGAAPGNNSIVPAEIIDFDPTLYLWKGINEGADDSGSQESNGDKNGLNANVVYLRELAPRY